MLIYAIPIIAAVCIWAFLSHRSKSHMRQATDHIPGPYCIPLLGCLHTAVTLNPKNVLKRTEQLKLQYGSIIKGWVFNTLYISTSNAELNEQILSSPIHLTKPPTYGVLREWLNSGLFLSDGKKWHTRRKMITPTFHFKILEQFLEIFDRQSRILIACLADKADGRTAFDILPYIRSAALDIVAETAMGINVQAQLGKNQEYTKAVHEMTEWVSWRVIRPYLHSDFMFALLYPYQKWRLSKLIRTMHDFSRKVIEERHKILTTTSKQVEPVGSDEFGSKKRMALLDVLLQQTINGTALSDEDIREEVDTFMFGGLNTVSSALSFILYTLSRYPQVQNKVLSEIQQVYGEKLPLNLTLMNLNELKYMENVIKEALRLYPTAPFIGREITSDLPYTHSELGDGIIPAGTNINIDIYNSLRDPRYFENPCDFIPERHESIDFGNAFSYIPFSAGPRNCIGQKYAMFEMKVLLVNIIRAYELLPLGPDVKPIVSIVMCSDTGIHVGLRKRTT